MLRKILFLTFFMSSAFASPVFHTEDCHPVFKPECPLYKRFHHGNILQRTTNNMVVNFTTLKNYYEHVSNGLIKENPDSFELQDQNYRPLPNQDRKALTFKINIDRRMVIPQQKISAETAGQLFKFDFQRFTQIMDRPGFLESKVHYYNVARYNSITQRFEKEIFHLTDWKSLIHPPIQEIEEIGPIREINHSSPFRKRAYHTELDVLTRTELTAGNSLTLMVNNTSYKEKIRLINNAKSFVFLAVMSFAPTEHAGPIIDALIGRAKAGLDVRVIMEGVWTMLAYKKTVKALRDGGVKVALANDLLRFGLNQGLFHSKYIVIDNEVGVMGGQNLVDRSHLSTGYNHFNKDTDVKVQGPVLTDMLQDYIILWERFTKNTFPVRYKQMVLANKEMERLRLQRGSEHYDSWLSTSPKGLCRFISQGPHSDKYNISKAYLATFEKMEKDLIYTSQHIGFEKGELPESPKWSTRIYHTLFKQAMAGKSVSLITNGIDGGFLKSAMKGNLLDIFTNKMNDVSGYLNTLVRRKKLEYVSQYVNFQVWQHFQYIHSKVALVDREVAAIGSYNFETYSAEKSHETAILCQDMGLVNDLSRDLRVDMANSTPLILTKD